VPDAPLRAGLNVSSASLAWTVASGSGAVVLGVTANSLVLVAFGIIGMLDAVGSTTLVIHFRHALRHESLSERRERVALRVVTVGMVIVGAATVGLGLRRLAERSGSESVPAGVALAAMSAVALAALAARKRRIASLVPSRALLADAWLSATGALLAVVTVAGTGLTDAFGWWWVDPAAATVVGVGAVGVGLALACDGENRTERGWTPDLGRD
jgi:divalent metal cation (Fe/Co/Zn/Cd) transporter